MNQLPCQGCRGLCCGPVPVTQQELKKIRKYVRSRPEKLRSELKNQHRYPGTCIFYDLDRDQCGIHPARPQVCRAFGVHKNLVCFRAPEVATKGPYIADEPHVGTLSIDFTWADFK